MSGLDTEPCVHGRRGEPCIYCELIRDGQAVPPVIDPVNEDELRLREAVRQLLMDAGAAWNRGGMKARWRGRFNAYLAWYLARRLLGGVHGIKIDIV